jgi:hypothetical protein
VVPDEPLSRLLEQSAQLEQKLAALSAQFSNEHPSVVAEMKAKATVENQIAERTQGILRGLQLQASAAQRRVEILEAEMNAAGNRSGAAVSGSRVGAMDESSRAKMKEMLQQELQISENLLKDQKKRIEVGTVPAGYDAAWNATVLGIKRHCWPSMD